MRILSSYIFRALCAMLVGFLLVSNPSEMTTLLVQIIGGLFVLSGLAAFINYFVGKFRADKTRKRLAQVAELEQVYIPSPSNVGIVVGVGSIAFGAFLLVRPALFINILMYVLGGLLVLIGIYQLASLIIFRRVAPLRVMLFLLPLFIIAAGVLVVCYPMETAALPFTILGVAYIFYGITEFIYGIRLHRYQKRLEQESQVPDDIPEAVAVEIKPEEAEAEETSFAEAESTNDGVNP